MKAMKWFILTFVVAAPIHAYAAEECSALTDAFGDAMRSKQGPAIESAFNAIAKNVECDFEKDKYRVSAIDAEIGVLSDPAQSSGRKAALAFVTESLSIAGQWRLAEKLGDYFWRAGNEPEAKTWYEGALSMADTHPAYPLSHEDRQKLAQKASGAWILASNDDEGRKPAKLIRAVGPDGRVTGVLALSNKGAKPVAVPLPVNFVFGKTDFTPIGQAAADDLATAIAEGGVQSLTLIGHADPVGDKNYNLVLSRQRADRLRNYLLGKLASAGAAPVIHTTGVGDTQPFDISVLPVQPSQEEIYALDRRVELIREDQQ
jgi:outer membrane protein OmpA-like peptidoglycan-associated protein